MRHGKARNALAALTRLGLVVTLVSAFLGVLPGPVAGQVNASDPIINEVDSDTPSYDTLEFIELYDGGGGNTTLDGYVLVLYNGSNDQSYAPAFDLDGYTTDANGYFVIGSVPEADIYVAPGSQGWLQNGADAVALYHGDAADFPEGTLLTLASLVDAIVYDTNDSDDAELLTLLNPGQPQVDEGGAGDKDNHSNQRCPDGSGFPRNTDTYAQWSPTPGAENTCAPPLPDILINEVDSDTPSTDTLEFIELYDGGVGNTALDGLVVVLYNGSDDQSYAPAFDLDGYTTDANGYFVIGSVPGADIDVPTGWLQNGADAVALYVGDATAFPEDTPLALDNLVDAIVYDTADADDAGLLPLLNAGQPQVDEGGGGDKDIHSNQRCPNGSGGARNTDTYAQFLPTPGEANTCAPPPVLLINEVDSDTPSTDTLEFIELYDGGAGNTALDGLVLVLYNGSDDQSYTPAFDLDGYTTDANGYFVIGSVPGNDIYVDPGSSGWLQNGADAVALFTGNAIDFPNDTPLTTANLIDAIVYDTADADDAGLLPLLNAGQPQVDEGGGGDKDIHSNQRCPNGSGGARNTDTYAQFLPTPGLPNACLPPVFVNEVDADTPSTDNAEFVELYDGGLGNTSLTGMVLVLFNGSSDTSYNAFNLQGYSTDANGYFVLCGDATNVPNCDLDVSPDTDLIQNGADAVALYLGDAALFPAGTPTTTIGLLDAIVYDTNDGDDPGLLPLLNAGEPQVNEGGGGNSAAHSNQRCPNGSGGARNTSTYAQFVPTPGEVNTCFVSACGNPATFIHDIQGSGMSSPEVGNTHAIEGVVVGDFQTSAHLRGFFLQEEDADADADGTTSEGIFVYDGSSPAVDVNVGDIVRVEGTVTEYYELTELTSVSSVEICPPGGAASAATVSLPVADTDDWEWYEGMLVTISQTLYATGNYYQGRYGEVDLSVGGRLDNPTNVVEPGAPAIALQDLNDRSRIQLEDGSTAQNPVPVPYIGTGGTLRAGDTIPSLTGVVNYAYDYYEVHPTTGLTFSRVNTRDAAPPAVGGTVKVASFNVLNYFSTIDPDPSDDSSSTPDDPADNICGPAMNQECRGADSADEFTRQRDKIIAAIVAMDAPVVGLIEIENHPTDAALQDLVSGLNDSAGAGTYAAINTGPIGTDAIKVAFVYKPGVVTPVGTHAILDSSVDPTFLDDRNRPVLAQTFQENATGAIFTAAVNHLKSKGSSCDDIGDPDTGDGQGNCNITRTTAATALVNWLATDPTYSFDPDFLIIGDLNSYAKEDPIDAIKAGGYSDLLEGLNDPYTYVFSGQKGYLDHALANASLSGQVSGVAIWHINADEPVALDYNDYNQPAGLYNPDQYCASDHDPVLVGLDLVLQSALVVEKQTDPDGAAGTFTFSGDAAGTIADDGLIVVTDLEPGTYTSQETVPPGWDLTSIVCDDDNSSGDVNTATATFLVEEGETVRCVFTNTQQGTIVVEKQTDPDGAPEGFTFSGDAYGTIPDNSQIVVPNLPPGTYTSQETVRAGWDLTSIVCNDTNSSGDVNTATATFQLDAGETVTCIFTNRLRKASIGGWIWFDDNVDGIQGQNEQGIAGVTVILYDCQEELLATTVSNAAGLYAFDDVIDGNYNLAFVPPLGFLFTFQDRGSDDGLDSDPDRTTGETGCFYFDARQDQLVWDAGLFQPSEPPPQPPDQPEPPPVVPEASTLLLLGSAAAGLAGYASLQWRARRRRDK